MMQGQPPGSPLRCAVLFPAVAVLATLTSGCSTFLSQTNDSRLYGGVRVNRYLRADVSGRGWTSTLWLALLYLDLPLSAVADTVLLPGTLPMELLSASPASLPADEEFVVAVSSRVLSRPWLRWAHHYSISFKRGDDDRGIRWLREHAVRAPPRARLSRSQRLRRELNASRRRLHAVFTGARAEKIIEQLEDYRPEAGDYRAWPGPNSNTRAAKTARAIEGLAFQMDHNACGKDFTPWVQAGLTTSRTGVRLDTLPLGVAIGGLEGIELHFLELTFGVSVFPPALKIPFLQRLGFPAWVIRD